MYYVITDIFRDKMTKVFQGTLEDCINYVGEDTDIYIVVDENNNIIEPYNCNKKGEINMDKVYTEMTNEELIVLRKEINKILAEREEEKAKEAIENFRKAFEEVKKVVYEIRVGEEWADNCHYIEDFEQFHFDI